MMIGDIMVVRAMMNSALNSFTLRQFQHICAKYLSVNFFLRPRRLHILRVIGRHSCHSPSEDDQSDSSLRYCYIRW